MHVFIRASLSRLLFFLERRRLMPRFTHRRVQLQPQYPASYFSFLAFSIPAFSTLCSFVPHFPVLHFHVLYFCATFSSLAFFTPCRFVPHFPVLRFHVSHFQRPCAIIQLKTEQWCSKMLVKSKIKQMRFESSSEQRMRVNETKFSW